MSPRQEDPLIAFPVIDRCTKQELVVITWSVTSADTTKSQQHLQAMTIWPRPSA